MSATREDNAATGPYARAARGHGPHAGSTAHAPLIVVVGGCGGAGASTIAASLAVSAVRAGRRAALFDADPFSPGLETLIAEATVPVRPVPARREPPWPHDADPPVTPPSAPSSTTPRSTTPPSTPPPSSAPSLAAPSLSAPPLATSLFARPTTSAFRLAPGHEFETGCEFESGCEFETDCAFKPGREFESGRETRRDTRCETVATPRRTGGRPDLALVTWDSRTERDIPVSAMRDALRALRRAANLIVVDLPRRIDDAAHLVLSEATHTLLVTPVAERAVIATGRFLPHLTVTGPRPHLVLRLPGRDQLTARDVAVLLALPVAGVVRPGRSRPAGARVHAGLGGRSAQSLEQFSRRFIERAHAPEPRRGPERTAAA